MITSLPQGLALPAPAALRCAVDQALCCAVQVGYAITTLPEGMTPLRQLKRVYDQRREMVETGKGIDWGFAEALAFGTLLSEGAAHAMSACASRRTRQGDLRGVGCEVVENTKGVKRGCAEGLAFGSCALKVLPMP